MTTTDLKAAAEAAKAATAAYIAYPTDRETGRQWDRACAEFSLACTEDAILALIRERDEALRQLKIEGEAHNLTLDERDKAQAALAAVGDLVKALEHARESIQLWADIASDASQTRHDPSDDIARIDAALKSVKEPPAPPPLTPSIPDRR